jgi:hypothetical protein
MLKRHPIQHGDLIKPNKARLDNRWGCSVGEDFRNFNTLYRFADRSRPSDASARR